MTRLGALFASLPVITEEQPLDEPVTALDPAEARAIEKAVERRRIEFAAGRYCARRALSALGIHGHPLVVGADRAPRWPDGVVGSITHTGLGTDGYCGVAVARAEDLQALGIDAELTRPLDAELWDTVLTGDERALVARASDGDLLATVIFSAKESVYKALSPQVRRILEFHEVHVAFDPQDQSFRAQLLSAPHTRIDGRFVIADDLILTAAFAAAAPTRPREER